MRIFCVNDSIPIVLPFSIVAIQHDTLVLAMLCFLPDTWVVLFQIFPIQGFRRFLPLYCFYEVGITRNHFANHIGPLPTRWPFAESIITFPYGQDHFPHQVPNLKRSYHHPFVVRLGYPKLFSFCTSSSALSWLSYTPSMRSIMYSVYSLADNTSCLATRQAYKLTSISKTTSCPYTSSYGVTLVAPCFEILCAHKASDNTSCHHHGVVSIFFLMSLISTLLLDSACPLACA
jgi:hypothetical protein